MIDFNEELIYGFTNTLLSAGFDELAGTPECHREWWRLCCSKHKRIAIAAPRGHAKTTAITKSFVLASVLFKERKFVVIVSDTYRQACMFLAEIKNVLLTNDNLRALFEIEDFDKEREDDIVVKTKDSKFRIIAVGSEQKVRGFLWEGMRPDLIVGDDMENDELVMNPERRDKFRTWFVNALLPILSERGIVRIVGTILHMDSLLERFMPKDRDINTENMPTKSVMKKPKNGWMGVRYRAHDAASPMESTHILWPAKWSKDRLEDVRQIYLGQGNPEGYSQEYLNRPIDAKSAFFRVDDFQDFTERDHELPFLHYPTYLSIDTAFSTEQRRDWTVAGIGSTDETGLLYLRHLVRDRIDSKEVVDTILRLHDRYKFSILLIGKGSYEKSIGPFLKERMAQRGIFFHIEAIPETTDKRQRAQGIRARMRSGGCKFDKQRNWYPDLEQELLEFDRGTHDDQVDMLSLFGMYLDKMMTAPTHKEIEDEEWELENSRLAETDLFSGRSAMTGY